MHEGRGAAQAPIRIGEFLLDPVSGELHGHLGRHSLSAQPLNVLLALVERPGRAGDPRRAAAAALARRYLRRLRARPERDREAAARRARRLRRHAALHRDGASPRLSSRRRRGSRPRRVGRHARRTARAVPASGERPAPTVRRRSDGVAPGASRRSSSWRLRSIAALALGAMVSVNLRRQAQAAFVPARPTAARFDTAHLRSRAPDRRHVVAGWTADRVRVGQGRQLRHLHAERRWRRAHPPHEHAGQRHPAGVVAGRATPGLPLGRRGRRSLHRGCQRAARSAASRATGCGPRGCPTGATSCFRTLEFAGALPRAGRRRRGASRDSRGPAPGRRLELLRRPSGRTDWRPRHPSGDALRVLRRGSGQPSTPGRRYQRRAAARVADGVRTGAVESRRHGAVRRSHRRRRAGHLARARRSRDAGVAATRPLDDRAGERRQRGDLAGRQPARLHESRLHHAGLAVPVRRRRRTIAWQMAAPSPTKTRRSSRWRSRPTDRCSSLLSVSQDAMPGAC